MIIETFDSLSWQSCLSRLNLWQLSPKYCQSTFTQLQTAHAEPQRFYHTAAHIHACLYWVDKIQEKLEQPDWVRLAFYFHDAIYNPKAADNEAQSAVWAVDFLTELAASSDRVAWVEQAILATKSHAHAADNDTHYLLDIDISILGQSPDIYKQYALAIRQEYIHVNDADYCAGRTRVLQHFLDMPHIYQTDYFRERLETQARENLVVEMNQL